MVRSQLKPKLMLWLCVDALVREIEVPSYTRLTKLKLARSIGGNKSWPRSFEHHASIRCIRLGASDRH
jgi:hypothetical protein